MIKKSKIHYYSSPLLKKHGFIHAFFTKKSSEFEIKELGKELLKNKYSNSFIKQIHSCNITYGSKSNDENLIKADGLISDCKKQNLWIYTADCMPILFADKKNKIVAAIHCGKKGLEKNIIPKLIKKFEIMGSSIKDILVAIGPSISKNNYLFDKKTYQRFHRNFTSKNILIIEDLFSNDVILSNKISNDELISIDLKLYAYMQLINKNIDPNHIDLSNKCTFNLKNEFYSWRRSKTIYRQWNMISS